MHGCKQTIEIPWVALAMFCIAIFMCGFMITMVGASNFHWCALIGIVMIFVGMGGAMFCMDHRPFETTPAQAWDTVEIQNISSLSGGDSFGISGRGSFFLGSGSATVNGNTREIYRFNKVFPGGHQRGTIDAEGVTVIEDAQLYPYIEWKYSHATTEKKTYTDDGSTSGGYQVDKLMTTYIHVPNGTVMQEFKV